MLAGVERLMTLNSPQSEGLTGGTLEEIISATHDGDIERLRATDGHFAVVARDGQTVRLARTVGIPLRYFVAKMFHGPYLIVADRMERLYQWCQENKIAWQFDPSYTRMVPAHHLIEIDQIGCPDPSPRYHRFFDPVIGQGSADIEERGAEYIQTVYEAVKRWIAEVPPEEPIAIAFSGGIDSTSILLMALHALQELGSSTDRVRAFTLDLGGGKDATQAEQTMRELGLLHLWERIQVPAEEYNLEDAIATIEDYHPLDVECAAAALCLLKSIRSAYPNLKYLLDGDGGDENLKSYPLEDSDLTISSVLRNPLLYQEGWGVHAMKHSLTYSGGLSRSYVRTFAPAMKYGFQAFSPYSIRSVIAASLTIPFDVMLNGSAERLAALKGDVVSSGIRTVIGVDMPIHTKRRFQDGVGGETYRHWKVSKAWCKQIFLSQWEERLSVAWDPEAERFSGNDLSRPVPLV
ncbi:MAG: asparagine synthase-related protein [Armatimonadetes bacterium]|nr:asparagine synthase-related protein [Armatimonadota bacterium]